MLGRALQRFNSLYSVWVVALSVVAFIRPGTMLWFDRPWIFWSLAGSMLGMGLTLSLDDFRRIARMPSSVALGFACQYTIMPLCGNGFLPPLRERPLDMPGAPAIAAVDDSGGLFSNLKRLDAGCYRLRQNVFAAG